MAAAVLLTVGVAVVAAFALQNDDPATAGPVGSPAVLSAVAAATPATQNDIGSEQSQAQSGDQAAPASVSASDDTAAGEPVADGAPSSSSSDSAGDASPAESEEDEAEPAPEAAEPGAREVTVTPDTIRQGETTLIRITGDIEADRIFVSIDGYTGEMVQEEDVGWVGYVAVSPLALARRYNVVLDAFAGEVYETTFLGELTVVDAESAVEQITLDPDTAALLAQELVAIDNETRFEQYIVVSGPRLWTGAWRLPLQGDQNSDFGLLRSYNGGPVNDWHHGHDISAAAGSAIVAPAGGRVVFATELPVHGLGVILDHGAGVYSGYWHMSEISAPFGELVDAGDELGKVGSTGVSTGPHLHWEVIVQGQDVDPIQWTRPDLSR
jgi:murein DD-endopeptidase MepM/ murein hydrolase activator NlpD